MKNTEAGAPVSELPLQESFEIAFLLRSSVIPLTSQTWKPLDGLFLVGYAPIQENTVYLFPLLNPPQRHSAAPLIITLNSLCQAGC